LPVKNTFIHFEESPAGGKVRTLRCVKSEPPEPMLLLPLPAIAEKPEDDKEEHATISQGASTPTSCPSPVTPGASTPSWEGGTATPDGFSLELLPSSPPFYGQENCQTSWPKQNDLPVFSFTLRRADDVILGINTALNRRGHLIVESVVHGSALDSWNRLQVPGHRDRTVRPGDRVVKVNGITDPHTLLEECEAKMLLKLEIERCGGLVELQHLSLAELV